MIYEACGFLQVENHCSVGRVNQNMAVVLGNVFSAGVQECSISSEGFNMSQL